MKIAAVSGEVDGILGVIVSFTIGDMRVPVDALEDIFERFEIPRDYLPNKIRPVDAFKKATKAAERTFIRNDGGGGQIYKTLLVRPLLTTPTVVVRKLVEEVRDPANQRLIYDSDVGTFVFNKAEGSFKIELKEEYRDLAAEINYLYDQYCNYFDGNAIRRMVRNFLDDKDPMIVRPHGGTYFIPKKYADEVEAFADMINYLATRYATTMWETVFLVTPFVDVTKNREFLMLRWQLFVKHKCRQALREMKRLEKEGRLNDAAKEKCMEEIEQLVQSTREYEALLERELNDASELLSKLKTTGATAMLEELTDKMAEIIEEV